MELASRRPVGCTDTKWTPNSWSNGGLQEGTKQTDDLAALEIPETLWNIEGCADFQVVGLSSASQLVWITQCSSESSQPVYVLSDLGTEHRYENEFALPPFHFLWSTAHTILLLATWGIFSATNVRDTCQSNISVPLLLCNLLGDPLYLTLYHRADHVEVKIDFLPWLWWLGVDGMKGINLKSHSNSKGDWRTTRPQIACCDTMTGYFKDIYEIYAPSPPTSETKGHSKWQHLSFCSQLQQPHFGVLGTWDIYMTR